MVYFYLYTTGKIQGTAVGTGHLAVGTDCADGHRRHTVVGKALVRVGKLAVGTDWPSAQQSVLTALPSA